jgi:hypothetical protein
MAIVLGNYLSLPTTEGPKAPAPQAASIIAFAGVGNLTGTTSGRAYKSEDPNLLVWTEIQPAGNVDVNWTGIVCNSVGEVGKYIFAVGVAPGTNRGLWVSSDFGATFTQTLFTATIDNGVPRITIDPTGQYVYVYPSNGGILNISSDFGQTFTQVNYGATRFRYAVVNDAGNRLIRGTFPNGTMGISNNSGATFSTLNPFTQSNAADLAGINGEIFSIRFASSQLQFCKWLNSGATSSSYLIDANPVSYLYTLIKCNRIGQKVFAARGTLPGATSTPGKAFINFTGGGPTGWVELLPTGASVDLDYISVGFEDTGNRMLIGTSQRLYASIDNGTTFFETQPAGNVNASWQTINVYTR